MTTIENITENAAVKFDASVVTLIEISGISKTMTIGTTVAATLRKSAEITGGCEKFEAKMIATTAGEEITGGNVTETMNGGTLETTTETIALYHHDRYHHYLHDHLCIGEIELQTTLKCILLPEYQ